MNKEDKNNNFFKKTQLFIVNNLRNILLSIGFIFIIFISFQIYNYINLNNIKKSSAQFFDSFDYEDQFILNIDELQKQKNIFSSLSKLKLIQNFNNNNNFISSNELYKDLLLSNELDSIYLSSISAHAAYTLINATYIENTKKYLNDINFYIENISDDLENYFSIKKELEYLLLVSEIDINNLEYKNNSKVIEIYGIIVNSSLISSSIKERVKKIHEFQLYK